MDPYPAPAKLNLFLHVVGRRADGYHLLQTVFRFIDYGDVVHLALRKDGRIVRCHDLPGVTEDRDLTIRAARLLQAAAGTGLGVEIRLEKRLPQGGGLGGGSSDAATVLLALNRLWGLDLPRRRLEELALCLGADVPAFVFGQCAFAEGVGEKLSLLTLPPAWYVVLTPAVQVSTAEVFAAAELTRNTPPITIADFSVGLGHNDLEPVVRSRSPVVGRCLDWLGAWGDARMTGSGACVFLAVPDQAAAQRILDSLPADMQGFIAAGLDRHPLYDLAA
ncbi:MAG TPA: 4-(cytidine 5'-diphospho)-2-C-methyl-D-erythritol kinase [Thiobacillaceae bacterium]|nr:4-(cytidine 5'-diphospho)-2-C-methyl-D-erythritol kinase [Thiobacillaceae bacterium]